MSSPAQVQCENAIIAANNLPSGRAWKKAVNELNGLNMFEILLTLDRLDPSVLDEIPKQSEEFFTKKPKEKRLWSEPEADHWPGSYKRILFAYDAVKLRGVPNQLPADLPVDQVQTARLFFSKGIGEVTNHKGMIVDLFADLGRSADPKKKLLYQSALAPENNDTSIPFGARREIWDKTLKNQPIKESIRGMDCGTHAKNFVVKAFGKAYGLSLRNIYYKPAISGKKADLKMKPDIVRSGVIEIRRLLMSKTAIIVRAVHTDGFSFPIIRDSSFTHFLIIVGYGGNRFLCLDPWPGGSRLTYTSGLLGDVNSAFMGILEYFPSFDQIRTPSEFTPHQAHDYIVIQGP